MAPPPAASAINHASADAPSAGLAKPEKAPPAAAVDGPNPATPTRSAPARRGLPPSSSKRRRLDSEEENTVNDSSLFGRPRKLSYEATDSSFSSEDSDDDDDDSIANDLAAMQQESTLRKIQRLNYEGDEDQLLFTAASAKLFEHVKDVDVVAERSGDEKHDGKIAEGAWKYRGSGCVKVSSRSHHVHYLQTSHFTHMHSFFLCTMQVRQVHAGGVQLRHDTDGAHEERHRRNAHVSRVDL